MYDKNKKIIYLDYNATTPIDPEVTKAIIPYLSTEFGNPSSTYIWGENAKEAIAKSRAQLADLIDCTEDEIFFTSGGTESNNLAIKGACLANRAKGNHIITSQIEHPAVKNVFEELKNNGFRVSYIPVNQTGQLEIKELEKRICQDTILVSIMHANNEVGTIQPIEEISKIIKDKDIILHCDAAQSIGKIPVSVNDLGVDLLSIAGHKFYATKGVGALYIKKGIKIQPLMQGASQEKGLRPGTENVALIVGLGKAAQLIDVEKDYKKYEDLRDYFELKLVKLGLDIHINGDRKKRLPNTSSVGFAKDTAQNIIEKFDSVAVSAGAACHSDKLEISDTLKAMKVPLKYAKGTIRFSLGRFTNRNQIDRVIQQLSNI